jgi:aspartate aminotransferase
MMQRVSAINGISAPMPKGAFYVFADISDLFGKKCDGKEITCAMDFADMLLEKHNTAVVPGEAFGDSRYIRLAYATSIENIRKGMDRIEAFVNSLA